VVSEGGNELILGLHKPGEIFGELCFCGGERREQAMAIEESEVVEIRFDNLATESPGYVQLPRYRGQAPL